MDIPRNYYKLRPDTNSGCIDNGEVTLTFHEWWNGEGVDIMFDTNLNKDNKPSTVSLHHTELHHIAVIAHALGMLDTYNVLRDSKALVDSCNRS